MSNPALLSPLKFSCVKAFFSLCSLWSLSLIPKFSFAEIQRFFGLDTFWHCHMLFYSIKMLDLELGSGLLSLDQSMHM